MKRKAAIALLLAIVLLVLFVVAVGWEAVFDALRRADVRLYALAVPATLTCLFCRTLVWHRVLSVVDKPRPYWLVGGLFLTATFAKYVTPYGQVTSGVGVAAVVSRYYDSAYEAALAAIVSADFINYLPYYTLGSIGLGYLFIVHSPPVDIGGHFLVAGMVVSVCLAGVVLVRRYWGLFTAAGYRLLALIRRSVERVAPQRAHHFERESVAGRFEGFYATLDLVRRGRSAVAAALVYGHLGWLGFAVVLYVSAASIGHPISFGFAMLGVALSKIGFLFPTPGGVGGVEIALASVLFAVTAMSTPVALATAILYRFATYWFTLLLGGIASIALTIKDPLPPEAQ